MSDKEYEIITVFESTIVETLEEMKVKPTKKNIKKFVKLLQYNLEHDFGEAWANVEEEWEQNTH